MKQSYEYKNSTFSLDLAASGGIFQAVFGDKKVLVELIRAEGEHLELLIDVRLTSAYISRDGAKRWVTVNGQTLMLIHSGEARRTASPGGHLTDQLTAQMPGVVRAVMILEGESVKKGQTLAVIEAMKMENKLSAPFDAVVKKLLIRVGQTVEREQVLVELTAAETSEIGPTSGPGPDSSK